MNYHPRPSIDPNDLRKLASALIRFRRQGAAFYADVISDLHAAKHDARRATEAAATIGRPILIDDIATDLANVLNIPKSMARAAVLDASSGSVLSAVQPVISYYETALAQRAGRSA